MLHKTPPFSGFQENSPKKNFNPKIMTRKALNLKTNYNHKLGCDYIVHLDVAPSKTINESVADDLIFVINTLDHSHPPVEYKLDDIARFPLRELTDTTTRLSHGMTREEYKQFVAEKKYQEETLMALYYYKKVTATA